MARKIQFRRGLAATWTSTNPTLAIGEFGIETDTGRGKVGTGVTAWVSLPYLDAGAVAHIADTVAAHTAGAIAFTPAGTIAATDLQAAVVEVATDAAAATATVAGDLSTLSSATSAALATKAPLASPALTGTPTAPTAVTATSTTQLATTAFVQQERAAQAATDSSRYGAASGATLVGIGDSITQFSDGANVHTGAWMVYASVMSGQRIQYAYNAGVSGNTTTQMLARFATDVTPYAPDIVAILGGTNDIAQSVALDTTKTNLVAIIAACRSIGALPVLCTLPPSELTSPVNRKQQTLALNAWIRAYGAANRIDVVDFYSVLTEPTTGLYKTNYGNADGVHPLEKGNAAMGSLFATQLANRVPLGVAPVLCQSDVDDNNLISLGCFASASGTSLPTNWGDSAGTPSGSALSYVTDSAVPGKMFRITSTASSALRQVGLSMNMGTTTMPTTSAGATSFSMSVNPFTKGTLFIGSGSTFEIAKVSSVTGSGPYTVNLTRGLAYAHTSGEQVVANAAIGDRMAFSGVMTGDGGVYAQVGVACTSGSVQQVAAKLYEPVTRGVWYQDFTVPSGTTALLPYMWVGAGTGVNDFGQLGLYNLTRMSLVGL